MIYFNCDYTEGCHPKILERLMETNMMQTVGYGEDEICASARAKIRTACERDDLVRKALYVGFDISRKSRALTAYLLIGVLTASNKLSTSARAWTEAIPYSAKK